MRQSILHCLYSRHSDGFVRQRQLRRIVESAAPWVVPFVVQLVGEYLVEIIEWDCCYRSRFPDFRSYPGHDLAELLRTGAADRSSELSGRPRGGSGGR